MILVLFRHCFLDLFQADITTFVSNSREAVVSSLRGSLFEAQCIRKLQALPPQQSFPINLRELHEDLHLGQTTVLQLTAPTQTIFFNSLADLIPTGDGQLWIPNSKRFAGVDFIISPNLLFSVTNSLHHGAKMALLVKLMNHLDPSGSKQFRLIFLGPDDVVPNFNYQNYLTTARTKAKAVPARIRDFVSQWVTTMPLVKH